MQIINNKHPLSETNRLLHALLTGGGGTSIRNFESIFKKYCYYIENIPKAETFPTESMEEKLLFLERVTEVYDKLGKLVSSNMIKTFNKVSDEVFAELKKRMSDESHPTTNGSEMNQILRTIISVSKFNRNKAIALFKGVEKRLLSQKSLTLISTETANLYMKLMMNIAVYNRLLIETSIDALQKEIDTLSFEEVYQTLLCLSFSRFPTNRSFFLKALTKVNREFNIRIDHKSGESYAKSEYEIRKKLGVLTALSII
jgi:hypothetical protein